MVEINHTWINTVLIISLFLILFAMKYTLFLIMYRRLSKMHYELMHAKQRKAQAVILLKHRRRELEESKRANGNGNH